MLVRRGALARRSECFEDVGDYLIGAPSLLRGVGIEKSEDRIPLGNGHVRDLAVFSKWISSDDGFEGGLVWALEEQGSGSGVTGKGRPGGAQRTCLDLLCNPLKVGAEVGLPASGIRVDVGDEKQRHLSSTLSGR